MRYRAYRDGARQRGSSPYELLVGEERVGELIYRARDDVVTLIHTEIAPQFEGHGLGDQLVTHALDDIRARGLRIVPVCPFVGAYLRRTPSTRTSSSE